VAPHVLVQTSQTVTTLHSLITFCPPSLLWSNPCVPSVIDTALLLHLVGMGAMSPIHTCTCTLACAMPHTHDRLHSLSHSHSHLYLHSHTRSHSYTNDHAEACDILSPALTHTHRIKCRFNDPHMCLHTQCSHPHSIVFAFTCLYQDSQFMMHCLWVNTSNLALVSDTGSIVTFFLASMSCRKEGKTGLGRFSLILSGACVIFSIYYFSWLFSLLHSHLLLFSFYFRLPCHTTGGPIFRLWSASPANIPHMSVVGPSRHASALF
jgi:hypothetical protein